MARKRVIYWIGSDVLLLQKRSRLVSGAKNIAGSSWLAEEVRGHGYICDERLFPVEMPVTDVLPFPATGRLQVLCYVPDMHHELHGSFEIRSVAEQLPSVDFKIVGGTGVWWASHPVNVSFLGWSDDVVGNLAGAHVLLRRTSHDSFSAFVREGLVAGRHVVFTYDVPGGIFVESGDVSALVHQLKILSDLVQEKKIKGNQINSQLRDCIMDVRTQLRVLAEVYG